MAVRITQAQGAVTGQGPERQLALAVQQVAAHAALGQQQAVRRGKAHHGVQQAGPGGQQGIVHLHGAVEGGQGGQGGFRIAGIARQQGRLVRIGGVHVQRGLQAGIAAAQAGAQGLEFGQAFFLQPAPEQHALGRAGLFPLLAGGFQGLGRLQGAVGHQAGAQGAFRAVAAGAAHIGAQSAHRLAGKGGIPHALEVIQADRGLTRRKRQVVRHMPRPLGSRDRNGHGATTGCRQPSGGRTGKFFRQAGPQTQHGTATRRRGKRCLPGQGTAQGGDTDTECGHVSSLVKLEFLAYATGGHHCKAKAVLP